MSTKHTATCLEYIHVNHPEIPESIKNEKVISDEIDGKLKTELTSFISKFIA